MGKTKKRQIDDVEYFSLKKEIKDLKGVIKKYERQFAELEKKDKKNIKLSKKTPQEEQLTIIAPNKCPECVDGLLENHNIGDVRSIIRCTKCKYRKTSPINV